MNKSDNPTSFPNSQEVGGRSTASPKGFVHQPAPVSAATGHPAVAATRPAQPKATPAYVDPYLFETGYYASRAEYAELASASADRIQLRADVENARPKRPRSSKQ